MLSDWLEKTAGLEQGNDWTSSKSEDLLIKDEHLQHALMALSAISLPFVSQEEFYKTSVEQIAKAYRAQYAFIGLLKCQKSQSHIQTISGFGNGEHLPDFVYSLDGSPCQEVLQKNKIYVPTGLAEKYPDDKLLEEMGLDSYFGSVLKNQAGEPIGLVLISDSKPMKLDSWTLPLLDLFANRIAHEVERGQIDRQLRLTSSVYENSHDVVLILSEDWTIMKANKTLTSVTGWSEKEVSGQHLNQLQSKATHSPITKAIKASAKNGLWSGELWLKRKNGQSFPADCTIKLVEQSQYLGEIHYIAILSDVSEKKYAQQQMHRLAYFDTGTDLPNRVYFQEQVNKTLNQSRKNKAEFAVMFIDLDSFKAINDRHGHPSGDLFLRKVANRMHSLVTKEIFCARIGGDEFAILYTPKGDEDLICARSEDIAQKVLALINEPYFLEGDQISTSASIGIALYPAHGRDAKTLLRNADLATYFSKDQGKNRAEFFKQILCDKAENQATMGALLNKAISHDQFSLVFQSKHQVSDGAIIGAETLLRWQLDDESMVSPADFIPVAEENGQIYEIGSWVLKTTFEQIKVWQKTELTLPKIAINLSGRQILSSHFLPDLKALVSETHINPATIELEITETWLMEDPEQSAKLLQNLKAMGFSISIDDFGVAYSSMNYLRHFPIDIIKIDQSFIRDIDTEKSSAAIVSAIIAMGHSLGLTVLAEGVETRRQLKVLQDLGCDQCQGYLFSKPVAADQFANSSLISPLHNQLAG